MTTNNTILTRYHELGWVIHPLKGKIPITKGWSKFINHNECLGLFKTKNSNIGLLAGSKSGVIVLDIDKIKEKEDPTKIACGIEEWKRLVDIHGEPKTVKSITPSEGFHYFFKITEKSKVLLNTNKGWKTDDGRTIAWDLKGDDGKGGSSNIVLPPSINPETKKMYQWINDPFTYQLLEMPDWLLEKLTPKYTIKSKKMIPMAGGIPGLSVGDDDIDFVDGKDLHIKKKSPFKLKNPSNHIDLEFIKSILKNNFGEAIQITDVKFPFIFLKNVEGYDCSLCERIHDTDNPYILIHNQDIRFYCRRPINHRTNDNIETYFSLGYMYKTMKNRLLRGGELEHAHIVQETIGKNIVCINSSSNELYYYDNNQSIWKYGHENLIYEDITNILKKHISKTIKNYEEYESELSTIPIVDLLIKLDKKIGVLHCKHVCQYLRKLILDDKFESKLNKIPYLLPINDRKVMNLTNGELENRKREHYFSIFCNVSVGKDTNKNYIETMMLNICNDDQDLYIFFQMMLGFFLTGEFVKGIFIFWGLYNNGKSTLVNLMEKILGDFYKSIPNSLIIKTKNQPKSNEANAPLMDLLFARFCTFSETEPGDIIDSGKAKSFSGSDTQTARDVYGLKQKQFKTCARFAIQTNHLPNFNKNDKAMLKRIIYVPFDVRFVEESSVSKEEDIKPLQANEKRADNTLEDKIKNDPNFVNDFFNWLVIGAIRYYNNKKFKLPPCIKEDNEESQKTDQEAFSFKFNMKKVVIYEKNNFVLVSKVHTEYNKITAIEYREFTATLRSEGFKLVRKAHGLSLQDYNLIGPMSNVG